MGLASYGNTESNLTQQFEEKIKTHMVSIKDDGSIALNMSYFNFGTNLNMVNPKKWENLFGFSKRAPEMEITLEHMALAKAIQQITETIMLKLVKTAKKLSGCNNLVLAGGVALNCVCNSKILKSGCFENVWIQPASGDAGGALGAALATYHIYQKQDKRTNAEAHHSYLGPEYSDDQISKCLQRFKAPHTKYTSMAELNQFICQKISEGKVVGWFQGRMEFGPRALGNRSILANPLDPETQKKLNLKIKFREEFRPFAPSVLEEDRHLFFESGFESPYMLLVDQVKRDFCNPEPDSYKNWPLFERLYHKRSKFPAITHVDYSARVQTVSKKSNPKYWELLTTFKSLAGYGMLVNTSFNVKDEPIVCTPSDAYRCFMGTDMDFLVMGNYVLNKTKQDMELYKTTFS